MMRRFEASFSGTCVNPQDILTEMANIAGKGLVRSLLLQIGPSSTSTSSTSANAGAGAIISAEVSQMLEVLGGMGVCGGGSSSTESRRGSGTGIGSGGGTGSGGRRVSGGGIEGSLAGNALKERE